jgi:hypothetical protein
LVGALFRYASFVVGKAHSINARYPVMLDFACAASFRRAISRASSAHWCVIGAQQSLANV